MMGTMKKGDSLGDRMKDSYEDRYRISLTRRVPVIVRVDGRAFHTLTRKFCVGRYDNTFNVAMDHVARALQVEAQGCAFAYRQSDEISLLLTDYATVQTQPWFDYNLSKIVSIASSVATMEFNRAFPRCASATFDARAFNVPQDEVCNYFIWRQQDATRNAINSLGQEHFKHKELHGKTCAQVQEMLFTERGINFNKCSVAQRRGVCSVSGELDYGIPEFTKDRKYVERHVYVRED